MRYSSKSSQEVTDSEIAEILGKDLSVEICDDRPGKLSIQLVYNGKVIAAVEFVLEEKLGKEAWTSKCLVDRGVGRRKKDYVVKLLLVGDLLLSKKVVRDGLPLRFCRYFEYCGDSWNKFLKHRKNTIEVKTDTFALYYYP